MYTVNIFLCIAFFLLTHCCSSFIIRTFLFSFNLDHTISFHMQKMNHFHWEQQLIRLYMNTSTQKNLNTNTVIELSYHIYLCVTDGDHYLYKSPFDVLILLVDWLYIPSFNHSDVNCFMAHTKKSSQFTQWIIHSYK